MALRRLQGRALVDGTASGTALATDTPLSFWGGYDPETGEIIDRGVGLHGASPAGVCAHASAGAHHGGRVEGACRAVTTTSGSPRLALTVVDLTTGKATSVAKFEDADIGEFEWVNDERLVFSLQDRRTAVGERNFNSGLFSAMHDGGDWRMLIDLRYDFMVPRRGGRDPLNAEHDLLNVPSTGGNEIVVGQWKFDGTGDAIEVIPMMLVGLMRDGRDFDRSYRIIGGDGALRWVHGIGQMLRDEAGRPLGGDLTALFIESSARIEVTRPDGTVAWSTDKALVALPDGAGRFTFDDVPAGEWTVRVYYAPPNIAMASKRPGLTPTPAGAFRPRLRPRQACDHPQVADLRPLLLEELPLRRADLHGQHRGRRSRGRYAPRCRAPGSSTGARTPRIR